MIVGLDHIGLLCRDLDRSVAFYHGLLGIPIRERGTLEGGSAAAILGVPSLSTRFADLDLGDGHTLELIEAPDGVQAGGVGAGHFSLAVDDVARAHALVTAAGVPARSEPVTITEPGFWEGKTAFYTQDPDGRTVELIQNTQQHKGEPT